MNLDLTSTCVDLSWTDARAAEDLIRMIILSHTDDKNDVETQSRKSIANNAKRRIKFRCLPR
jgi:hypothetical protein